MPSHIDREKAKNTIRLLLENLKTGGDLQLISEYRSLFKKEVPLFRRSWAAAYLFSLCDQGARLRPEKKRPRKFGAPGKSFAGEKGGNGQSWQPLAEEESTRLFISAGRNRRVFPRELLGLIFAKTPVSREDIGTIRILDNYSFVQVRDTAADQIIEALNGQLFRGRPLAVNYARIRREGEDYSESAGGPEEEYGGELSGEDEYHPDEKEI
jgi:hypothetical protein